MSRSRDWEVITGWEKRIKVDFGSIGPNHVRWSDWTYKERDIVARKVHESASVSRDHGPRSKRMEDWAKENAPIMVDFARDGKPMPDWAHADYRHSSVPEYVKVVWERETPGDFTSHGGWAYDPPAPWQDKGEEPAWSARPMDGSYDPNTAAHDASTTKVEEGFVACDLLWLGDRLIFPIADIGYPDGKDELLCMVESKDPTRGGWVTMSALEALNSGLASSHTETVRNASDIDFVVPLSYNIQKHATAKFKLYYRKSNGGMQKPEYTDYEMNVPRKIIGLETEGKMDSKFNNVISYKTMPNGDHVATDGTIISTKESRANEDVPQWRKFELGRLEILDNVVIPGPNALAKDHKQYGDNVKLTNRHKVTQSTPASHPNPDRIMPFDPNYTSLEKALSWAKETQHGALHQDRWNKVAAALGADNGYPPMPLYEAEGLWERFGRNKRWTMAVDAIEKMEADDIAAANRYREAVGLPPVEESQSDKLRAALVKTNERPDVVVKEFNPETQTLDEIEAPDSRAKELHNYHNAPPTQGNISVASWKASRGKDPDVASIVGWDMKYIVDPQARVPLWKTNDDAVVTSEWEYKNGEWIDLSPPPLDEHVDDIMADAIRNGDWAEVARLAKIKASNE